MLPYAAKVPGANPLQNPKGVSIVVSLMQVLVTPLVLIVMVPGMVLVAVGSVTGVAWPIWVGGGVGLLTGGGALLLAVWLASRWYDDRQIWLLDRIRSFSSAE